MNVLDEHIPVGWDFPDRTTYREMVHSILNDAEMQITRTIVPVNPNKPFGSMKVGYDVRYVGQITRDLPPAVGEYYFSLVGDTGAV